MLNFSFFFSLNRGKLILGYTEAELCMRGSGYQFIHAADMLHCAEYHIRSKFWGTRGDKGHVLQDMFQSVTWCNVSEEMFQSSSTWCHPIMVNPSYSLQFPLQRPHTVV